MPTATIAPHRALLSLSRLLNTATKELAALNEALLPGHTPTKSRLVSSPPTGVATRVALPDLLAERLRKAGIAVTTHTPAPRVKPSKKTAHKLSDADKVDILLLLTQTNIPVTEVARLYGVKRPSIYNLRDKHKLKVHRGNPALMAGVARYKAKRHKVAKIAPPAPAAPVTPLPVVTTEDAAPPLLVATG